MPSSTTSCIDRENRKAKACARRGLRGAGPPARPPRHRHRRASSIACAGVHGRRAVLGRGHRRDAVRAVPWAGRAAHHIRENRRLRDALPTVRSTPGVSLHIPWDKTDSPAELDAFARARGLHVDAMNSNTFQDQPGQPLSYKFGSLSHPGSRGSPPGRSSTTSNAFGSARRSDRRR